MRPYEIFEGVSYEAFKTCVNDCGKIIGRYRRDIGVVAAAKGIIRGRLVVMMNDVCVNCMEKNVVLSDMFLQLLGNDGVDVKSDARYILVIEKETVFRVGCFGNC